MIIFFNLLFNDISSILKKIFRYYYWNIKGISVSFSTDISIKATIGENCKFTGNSQITSQSKIGFFTYGHNVNIHYATIGNYCSIGPDVKIGLEEHPLDRVSTHPKFYGSIDQKKVIICDHVWIGANSVILGGIVIGKHAVIGAGAVVTKDVEAYTIVGGVPAIVIRKR
jgi:virginiamycin A acetyltransferase